MLLTLIHSIGIRFYLSMLILGIFWQCYVTPDMEVPHVSKEYNKMNQLCECRA